MKLEKLIKESKYAHKEMKVNPLDDASTRWHKKEVLRKLCLYHSNTLENVTLNGKASIKLSNEYTFNNEMSLCFEADTKVENVFPRPFPNIKINFEKKNLENYNRLSFNIYPKASGHVNFYFHFSFGDPGCEVVHAPSLTPNVWNHITFEVDEISRKEVSAITIMPFLMGCPPEAESKLEVFISDVDIEEVEIDPYETWELDNRIAYCHSGYYQNYSKTAITSVLEEKTFVVVDENDKVVLTKDIEVVHNKLGNYYVLDFTEVKEIGLYKVKIGNLETELFEISTDPYEASIWKSMNFLRMLRCGEEVEGVHSHCHLNCRTVDSIGRSVPNFGGWHDAGDLSQFEICTAEMAHAILDLAEKYQNANPDLYERLLEEAKVGTNWLLRTRFGNGDRALAVSYGVWRDNVLTPDNETVKISKAENGPFENLLASCALAVASKLFQEDEIYSNWCKKAAIEDLEFGLEGYKKGLYTLRWGPSIDSVVSSTIVLASTELYLLTKDEKYISYVEEYSKIVMACQQKEEPNWDIPLRGFFYEDVLHNKILTYEHRGHEQTPIQGLARAYEVFTNHPMRESWKETLELYAEYVTKTIKYTYPYNLLPGHVYPLDKINIERFTVPSSFGTLDEALVDLKKQASAGIKLADDVYLRIFPVAIQRRGYHATLLSKTKAVSMIGKVLNRNDLKEIVKEQIEWILGKNPFASSTMYGEGHNYHPLYVAFSPQLVGALPVGIKTLGDHDMPYWPTVNNAVFKEIWGHTTGKYLWVLADL